jgi:hypothetical protein
LLSCTKEGVGLGLLGCSEERGRLVAAKIGDGASKGRKSGDRRGVIVDFIKSCSGLLVEEWLLSSALYEVDSYLFLADSLELIEHCDAFYKMFCI